MNYKHLVIVHGIGDQRLNETSISFMSEFIRSLPPAVRDTVEVHNLVERIDVPRNKAARPAYITCAIDGREYVLAFSEVYWQPVPNEYLKRNDDNPPVPVFTWAHSINTRLLHGGPRYQTARDAIDNLETMLGLLKRLAAIYKKSGLLADILTKFLCDVQMYVESDDLRSEINQQFLAVLANVGDMRAEIQRELTARSGRTLSAAHDIYIVSHSEGTVVSYNSLVQAAGDREGNPTMHPWLPHVRALVTLGSPIDKHYTIWRNRFRTDNLRTTELERKIFWRNYWDRSDPVGYGLQVLFPAGVRSDAARMFTVVRDDAYTRYPLPGKAHIDYWRDSGIHADILHEVVTGGPNHSSVIDKPWRALQVPIDYAAYLAGRLLTLAAILFFLNRILSPLHHVVSFGWACAIPGFPCGGLSTWRTAFWVLAGPVAVNGLLQMDRDWQSNAIRKLHESLWKLRIGWPESIEVTRWLVTAAWVASAVLLSFAVTTFDAAISIKDWIGFATGLVVSVLVWQLQTTIHSGLLQLWRYTGGARTAYQPPAQ